MLSRGPARRRFRPRPQRKASWTVWATTAGARSAVRVGRRRATASEGFGLPVNILLRREQPFDSKRT